MGAAEQLATPLTETLTWPEIQARFPYQYVVLVVEDDDISGGAMAIRGRVMSHSKSRKVAIDSGPRWDDPDVLVGFFYTGVGMPDEDRDHLPAER